MKITPPEVTAKFFETAPEPVPTATETHEENLVKIGDAVFNTENIFAKSDFNDDLVKALAKGLLYADRYNCSIMRNLCTHIAVNRLSLNRGSRKEFKEIAQSAQMPLPQFNTPPVSNQRFFGGE